MADFSLPESMESTPFNSGETALQQRWQTESMWDDARRQGMPAIAELCDSCDSCNMRDRYGPAELAKVGASLAAVRIQNARTAIGF